MIVKYIRRNRKEVRRYGRTVRRDNQKVGVFVAFKDGQTLNVGWSRCQLDQGDVFDRDVGINLARARALPFYNADISEMRSNPNAVPNDLLSDYDKFISQAEKHLRAKLSNFPVSC